MHKKILLFSLLFYVGRFVYKFLDSSLNIIRNANVGPDETSLLIFNCVLIDNEIIIITLKKTNSKRRTFQRTTSVKKEWWKIVITRRIVENKECKSNNGKKEQENHKHNKCNSWRHMRKEWREREEIDGGMRI